MELHKFMIQGQAVFSKLILFWLGWFFLVCYVGNSANSAELAQNPNRVFLITPNAQEYTKIKVSGVYNSIADFSQAVNCILPGDRILFEGGKEYQGRLKMSGCDKETLEDDGVIIRSFNPDSPLDEKHDAANAIIRSAPMASDLNLTPKLENKPNFKGKPISHLIGRTLYKVGPFKSHVNQVFYKDERLQLARFPKESTSANTSHYVPFIRAREKGDNCPSQTCLTFSDKEIKHVLNNLSAIEGSSNTDAYVVVRSSPWSLAKARISKVNSNGDLQLEESLYGSGRATNTLPSSGHGVIFLNSFAFLNDVGEWYFNSEDNCVYFLWDNKNGVPLSSQLRFSIDEDQGQERIKFDNAGLSFSAQDSSIKSRGKIQYLKIQGLSLYQSGGSGINVSGIRNIEILRAEVKSTVGNGIQIKVISNKSRIYNNIIKDVGAIGITATATPVIDISNNTIENAGYIGTQNRMEMAFSGINLNPGFVDATISSNLISGVGYAGIMVSEPSQNMMHKYSGMKLNISNNEITRFCRLLNDCGGIYINGQNKGKDDILKKNQQRKFIIANKIFDPLPNMDGTPHNTTATGTVNKKPRGDWEEMVAAIYLDRKASYYEVRSNQVSGQYIPYSWMVHGGGLLNTCDVGSVDKCNLTITSKSASSVYKCYTNELDTCNTVSK